MKKLNKILIWMSGSKGVIASLLSLTNGYLLEMEVYGNITFLYIGGVIVILFGIASFQTQRAFRELKK